MDINFEVLDNLSAADAMALVFFNQNLLNDMAPIENREQQKSILRQEIIILMKHIEKIKNNIFTH